MATSSSSSASKTKPANKLESMQKALHDFLHTPSAVTPAFELVEKYAKVKREYIFLGGSPDPLASFYLQNPDGPRY